jgi:hypothetical protein
MIYMHLLTWVGFGLIGYVPNTLYKDVIAILNRYKYGLKPATDFRVFYRIISR